MTEKAPTFQLASEKFLPLFTLKDPETGKRPHHIVLPGGRASGKSVSAALAVIKHTRSPKLLKAGRGLRVVIAREFGSSIDESFWAELKNAAEMMGVSDEYEFGVKAITHKYTKSSITSIGLERNKGSIKGLAQVDMVIVEEAAYVSQESMDILIPTIRKAHSVIFWLYNPMNRNDAVSKTFVECEEPYPETLIIPTNWRDNRFFSERSKADMEALRKTDEARYRNVYEGEYLGAEDNTLIKPIVIQEARQRIPVANPRLKIVAGFDVSGEGEDEAVIVRRQGNVILSVHTKDKGTTHQMTDWAKSVFIENHWDVLIVDATGSTGIADNMSEWGEANRTYETIRWMASRKSRNPNFYSNARTESWCIMLAWLRSSGMLTKDARWDELSRVTYRYTDKEQKSLDPKSKLQRSPDWGDALALSLWIKDEEPQKIEAPFEAPRAWFG